MDHSTPPDLYPERRPKIAVYLSGGETVDQERANRVRLCSFLERPLAMSAVALSLIGGTVVSGEAGVLPELAVKNVQALLSPDIPPDIRQLSGREAAEAVHRSFHLRKGYYIGNLEQISGPGVTWDQYQVLTMLELVRLSGAQSFDAEREIDQALMALDSHWSALPADFPAGYNANQWAEFGVPAERFVDDNLWMAQFYQQRYQRFQNEADAHRVDALLDVFVHQRDASDGAAYWQVQLPGVENIDKAIVSNATAIPVLVAQYLDGRGDERTLEVARETYVWTQGLLDPETGLYFDKIMGGGQMDTALYTYVQAEMLEAMRALDAVSDGDDTVDVLFFAERTIQHFSENGGYGIMKFDVIYLRSLMRFAADLDYAPFTDDVQQAIQQALAARPGMTGELIDAAAAASLQLLAELSFDRWKDL